MSDSKSAAGKANALAGQIYQRLKDDISNFALLPGDRFTETEMAERYGVSRTPVRDALYRLEREGYLQVAFRSGWSVRPFDFHRFDQLYDLRIVLELAAVARICESEQPADLSALQAIWSVPREQRLADGKQVGELDEAFHQGLILATGNLEMARVHQEVTDKIRIVRRLDFTRAPRIDLTYDEHQEVLRLLTQRKAAQAAINLRSHIEASKAEVHKITLHMIYEARQRGLVGAAG
ncbi:GntR family transcriptional regulator [Azoarcus sp. TTM-91]|uniref:GntR family transcriptional regulator n=1 Tax=Azoarcus sp. TTM-91 TaxID=2691581 RepID=UPI00145D64C0|nr:GntR family transcriptional regulator [Azoarcus sp. TTM-91]NMG35609.1 GntR family transcriptional regulator [Azoarcus sp. TTM-91]